ncbi:unnamed protein product [Rhizoctonia solani]|uniref:Superoxide dismutase copper/zinc binding domain-containing protein n=2 Tax=Rhizoctonia solani TaxID=456999 RepID=A0A8H3CDP5_9AGAM|nr:unnamed protein product [Rhizoctonia solani]CAE6480400.1 unnamed protein product [Rhizoctonia solani]
MSMPYPRVGYAARPGRGAKLYAQAEIRKPMLGIDARLEFMGTEDGEPTFVMVRVLKGLTNNPALGGPFGYHIHTNPIPPDGNCTKAFAHHDPLNVTERLVCDPAFPQFCQLGDLSGKHGKLNGTTDGKIASFGYSDAYLRFFPQSHSLLGRSVVIHSSNRTRIACGNITSRLDGTADASFKPTHKRSTFIQQYPTSGAAPPTTFVIPFNGTTMTDSATIAALPYPLPVPALSLAEALNVELTNITRSVKFANTQQLIIQPNERKVNGSGPFSGR